MLVIIATIAIANAISSFFPFIAARPEMRFLCAAIALRVIYYDGTPYFVRSHDVRHHILYIDYIAQYGTLPDRNLGWETFQPPLYYALAAALEKGGIWLGMVREQVCELLQACSLILSISTIGICFLISREIFPGPQNTFNRHGAFCIMAFCPSLMFNAARINNDTLFYVFAFASAFCVIRFWIQPRFSVWLWLSLFIVLSLLAKASAFFLLLIAFLCLAIKVGISWKRKILYSLLTSVFCLVFVGWFYLPTLVLSGTSITLFVANAPYLPASQRIADVFLNSVVFNPLSVLEYPFVYSSEPRKGIFLEYFFKSAFFGQWGLPDAYKWAAQAILIPAMLIIPIACFGLVKKLLANAPLAFPLAIMLGVLFFGQWAFVQMCPYQSSQEFRYSNLLVVPISYYIMGGIQSLPKIGQDISNAILQMALVFCAVYWIIVPLIF